MGKNLRKLGKGVFRRDEETPLCLSKSSVMKEVVTRFLKKFRGEESVALFSY